MNRAADGRRLRPTPRALPEGHPAYGLVSRRRFEDLRENDLAPRPTRESRPSGSGRISIYPPATRAHVEHVLALQSRGVSDKAQLRILLWLDGFAVPAIRIEADLPAQVAVLASYNVRMGPTAADQVVMKFVHSDRPTPFAQWARKQVPDRQLLEDAFVQMSQLALGVRPSDLMLDAAAARPLHDILTGMFPGIVKDVDQLVEVFDDPEFNSFVGDAATFAEWSIDHWREARDALVRGAVEPPAEIRGDEYFAFRFSLLLASGAAIRRMQRQQPQVQGTNSPDHVHEEAS